MIAEQVIKANKRTDTGEIIVTLFELCDLNCLFCNQDHDSVVGLYTVQDKLNQIKQSIEELKETKGKTNFSINIMGGEVFSDKVPDSVFDDYVKLTNAIYKYGNDTQTLVDVRFVTNFVWTKKERVYKLLQEASIVLGTSYDPSGRFNKDTFEIFQANVKEFKDHIQGVNIVLTKPNIERFLKDQVPFFDYLYDNFDVYFDHYTPEGSMNHLLPFDVDLRDIAKLCIDKYPKAYPYVFYKNKDKNNMTCMDTLTVVPDGTFGRCTILLTGNQPGNVIPIKVVPMSKKDMEQKWFDSYDCLSCEYFGRCALGCFLSNHIKDGRTQEECWMKEVYDYVDSKN